MSLKEFAKDNQSSLSPETLGPAKVEFDAQGWMATSNQSFDVE